MDQKALEARRAYKRAWAKAHPERIKAAQERFWKRQAERAQLDQQQQREAKQA